MNLDQFKKDFVRLNGVWVTDLIVLMRDPLELINIATGESHEFISLDEALEYELDGKTIGERFDGWPNMYNFSDQGGRGGDSGFSYSGGFPDGMDGGIDESRDDFPARINTKLGAKRTYEDVVNAFINEHGDATVEHGAVVDAYGFATKYRHGNAGSISGLSGNGTEIALHNHPNKGWPVFSKSDVVNTALGTRKGIVAVSTKKGRDSNTSKYAGIYSFVKGDRFNASGFVKAISNATVRGKDLNDAAHRWLKNNQKKYDYTYTFKPAKG